MAGQVNADTVAVQLETVAKEVPVGYERDDTFLSKIEKRAGEEDVSSRAMRVAMQVRPGGRARQVSFDNGALGRGGASQYLVSTLSPIDFVFAVELSKKVEISTNSRKKALFDVVNRETASALKQARTFFDILAQGPGSGILNVPSNISTTTWTLSTAAGPQTAWFYVGQGVNLFTSTMATKRANTAIVQTIDPVANQITVDALPTNGVTGDVIAIEGLTAGAGLAQTLTGLAYHVNSANTGTWQNVNRANYPEIRSVEYAAGGAALALPFARLLINKMAKRLGVDFATGAGIEWWGALEQKHAYEDIAQAAIIINKNQGATQKFDGAFEVETIVGLPTGWGIHADPTTLYALKYKSFIRAVSLPLGYYQVPGGNGQTRFPIYDATDGGLDATVIWYLATSFQLANNLPQANGLISGLGVPSGY